MAFAVNLLIPTKPPFSSSSLLLLSSANSTRQVAPPQNHHVVAIAAAASSEIPVMRRSANYQPPSWKLDHIIGSHQPSVFLEESYRVKACEMKEEINVILGTLADEEELLELIDDLQRLGVSYHFEQSIKQILTNIYNTSAYLKQQQQQPHENNLYSTALYFRLLRQHGFNVSPDIFDCYHMEGDIKPRLYSDTRGLLSLYEASYLLVEGESIMESLMESATKLLKKKLIDGELDDAKEDGGDYLGVMVRHALELPLHWRTARLEARWFIDIYEKTKTDHMNPLFLDFAKLDFNIVQAHHMEDFKHVSRWWERTGLAQNLPFVRDRIVEKFFWTIVGADEPEYGYLRQTMAKVNSLITVIDDVFDVYGTLDELELFANAVERWDMNAIDELPEYMKLCFLALFNFVNDVVYDVLKQPGSHNIAPYLTKAWTDLCKMYIQETRWYLEKYTPTLEEYLNGGWISIGAPMALVHVYFGITRPPFEEQALECLTNNYHNIIRWTAMIGRLVNDLATSSDEIRRGDVSKSIQCYMKECGVSEEEARRHMKFLIGETWKKMNRDGLVGRDGCFSEEYVSFAIKFTRTFLCIYEHGDGHGNVNNNDHIKDRISKLLFYPIPLQ